MCCVWEIAMKRMMMVILCFVIVLMVGCANTDKDILVKYTDNCKFSKKLMLTDDGIKYYTSCIDDVTVRYGVDSSEKSLFDEIKNGKITMDEIYDRSLYVNNFDGMTSYKFDKYYVLKCNDSVIFGNIDNDVDKRYCFFDNDEIISLNDIGIEYNYKDAIKDSYYVITENKSYNSEVLEHFLETISDDKPAFVRIFSSMFDDQNTIIDVSFSEDGVLLTVDNTRDKNVDNSRINNYNFDKLGIFEDEVGKYLYAYNGSTIDSESDDSFLITKIIDNG